MRVSRLGLGALSLCLVLAVVFAVVAVRRPASAFTPPATGVYVALDCDVGTPGIQQSCTQAWNHPPFDYQVGIVVGNVDVVGANITAFNADVIANDQTFDPHGAGDGNLNGNPDFNHVQMTGTGWSCAFPPPEPDQDPSSTVIRSFISCSTGSGGPSLPPGTARTVAVVHYSAPFGGVSFSTDVFSLENVAVYDNFASELISCNPVITIEGPCTGADVTWVHVFPTNTPVANDWDNDGVPDGTDICMFTANVSQVNTDANLISNAPHYVVNDVTRAMSDGLGDACDFDDDADAFYDVDETQAPPCGFGATVTNPVAADTDGDRVLDAAECALGYNPTNAGNKPTITECGSMTDADGDRLVERLERCFYNTDPGDNDSDNDGTRDGCEAFSLNMDVAVNSGDQLLLSQEIVRRLGGGAPHLNFDLNKDGNANSGDQLLMAGIISPPGQCP